MKYSSIKYIDKKVKNYIEELVNQYCKNKKFKLVWILVGDEELELVVDYPQTISAVEVVRGIKATTSRSLREYFPDTLGKQKSFWINARSQLVDARTSYIFVSLNPDDSASVEMD